MQDQEVKQPVFSGPVGHFDVLMDVYRWFNYDHIHSVISDPMSAVEEPLNSGFTPTPSLLMQATYSWTSVSTTDVPLLHNGRFTDWSQIQEGGLCPRLGLCVDDWFNGSTKKPPRYDNKAFVRAGKSKAIFSSGHIATALCTSTSIKEAN